MIRLLALASVLALCACARQEPVPLPSAPPPAATTDTAPARPAAASTQSEIEQATRSQESGGGEAEHSPSDTSLEQMAAAPAAVPLPVGKWKPGVNYTLLVPAQTTSVAAGKIEVLEVFWLACPHCYEFEPFVRTWLKSKPAYVEFVRVPVIWQGIYKAHARLYYTLVALGHQDLVEKAFDTIAQQRVPLAGNDEQESFRLQQKFATDNGVSADDFAKAYNSFSVNSDLMRAEEITQRYRVQGVPFIVVNGKYTTDVAQAGGYTEVVHTGGEAKLIELINDLTAAEHGH
jgi:protein dithiol oxidoreductase (disulfide-forming)